MKRENDSTFDQKIQKALNKLISEEQIATDFYIGCVAAACPCQAKLFQDEFMKIAIDERDDHCKHLTEWAIANDYSVPFKYKDYEKYADSKAVKSFNNLKEGLEAAEYIYEAIKQEEWAIDSYNKIIETVDMPYDLHCILIQNLYDEKEHLEDLKTMSYAFDAGVEINI